MNFDFLKNIVGLSTIISLTAVVLSIVAALYALLKTRQAQLDLHNAKISVEREYYERNLQDLTDKLVRTEDRWKEMNYLLLESIKSQSEHQTPVRQRGDLGPNLFFSSLGIDLASLSVKPDQVFVLTPFSYSYKSAYDEIAKVCREVGLVAKRGDEEHISGGILLHIIREIAQSRLVIANISGRNPNVFYELGIAQSIGKPVLIVSKSFSEIPFDLRQQQLILYEKEDELRDRLRDALVRIFAKS